MPSLQREFEIGDGKYLFIVSDYSLSCNVFALHVWSKLLDCKLVGNTLFMGMTTLHISDLDLVKFDFLENRK